MENKSDSPPTTLAVLVRAKAELIDHGWRQGFMGSAGRPRCLLGACEVNPGFGPHRGARDALERALDMCSVAAWNDAGGRSKGEVLALIDQAIDLEVRGGE